MKRRKNRIGTIIVIIITVLLLGAGYILYDKYLNKEEPDNVIDDSGQIKEVPGITEDEEYFNELLATFLSHSNNYMKNYDSFSDSDITTYLTFYYTSYANEKELGKYSLDKTTITYDVSKKELDDMVLKVFGKKEYKIIEIEGKSGIKRINDNIYQIYWTPTGWYVPDNRISEITKTDTGATIAYILTGNEVFGEEGKEIGTLKFYLTKNENNWNITKIDYIENK